MKILETERLIVRPFTLNDAPFIIELLNSPGWLQFIGDRNVKTQDDAVKYITNGPMYSYKQNGFGLSMVELKESNTPIGMCGLLKRDALESVDIGFALLPAYEGKGYAFEAAAATINQAHTDFGMNRILAIVTPTNNSSKTLLQRLGFGFKKMITLPSSTEDLMLFEKADSPKVK